MKFKSSVIEKKQEEIKELLGNPAQLVIKDILIGKDEIEGKIFYINGLASKETIDRDILRPLMLGTNINLGDIDKIEYISKKYITASDTKVLSDLVEIGENLKRGKTAIVVDGFNEIIVADTIGGEYRGISDPENETSIRGSREGFVENIEVNISILKRKIKDKNLKMENFTLGKRSDTDVAIMYIEDITDDKILSSIRERIKAINVDKISGAGIIEQLIEKHTFSVFPQALVTERPDIIEANLLEGKIAVFISGTPFVMSIPSIFIEFFQAVEDYNQRTIVASFSRLVRFLSVIIIINLPAVYITLIKFNIELIPIDFIKGILQSRKGIALTPFMSIISINLTVEFLREGGLRLPGKVGQILSVVGGIIIGDAAIKAKIVSPTTLLVVGISTVATFLIPNYEMALSIRMISYPMLILGNWLGMYGIVLGNFFIVSYLSSLDSFGVAYFSFRKKDLKDSFIRAPIPEMKERPEVIPLKDRIRLKMKKNT